MAVSLPSHGRAYSCLLAKLSPFNWYQILTCTSNILHLRKLGGCWVIGHTSNSWFQCFQEAEVIVPMDDRKHDLVGSFLLIFRSQSETLSARNWKDRIGPFLLLRCNWKGVNSQLNRK